VATSAALNAPRGIAINPVDGKLYIADTGNNRIVKIDNGTMTTVVSGQTVSGRGYGNLLVNPGAESPVNSDGTIPGWDPWGGAPAWFPVTRDQVPANQIRPEPIDGDFYFRPDPSASARLTQIVSVTGYPAGTKFSFQGYVASLPSGAPVDQTEIVLAQRRALRGRSTRAAARAAHAVLASVSRAEDSHRTPSITPCLPPLLPSLPRFTIQTWWQTQFRHCRQVR